MGAKRQIAYDLLQLRLVGLMIVDLQDRCRIYILAEAGQLFAGPEVLGGIVCQTVELIGLAGKVVDNLQC